MALMPKAFYFPACLRRFINHPAIPKLLSAVDDLFLIVLRVHRYPEDFYDVIEIYVLIFFADTNKQYVFLFGLKLILFANKDNTIGFQVGYDKTYFIVINSII